MPRSSAASDLDNVTRELVDVTGERLVMLNNPQCFASGSARNCASGMAARIRSLASGLQSGCISPGMTSVGTSCFNGSRYTSQASPPAETASEVPHPVGVAEAIPGREYAQELPTGLRDGRR
jgi:hypothetical protein